MEDIKVKVERWILGKKMEVPYTVTVSQREIQKLAEDKASHSLLMTRGYHPHEIVVRAQPPL